MFRFTDAQSKIIKNLYNNEQLSDLRIIVDGPDGTDGSSGKETIYAHRFLLCISSEHARNMFMRGAEGGGNAGGFQETQTGIMDLSGYDPVLVKLCIRSLYDPEYANTEITSIISGDPEMYGFILDLVSYLGLNRLQIGLESIGYTIFDKIWMSAACRLYLVNALVNSPGTRKKGIAHRFMNQYTACLSTIKKATTADAGAAAADGPDGANVLQQCIEYVEFMQNLDASQMKQITKLGSETSSEHTAAFRLWTQWYTIHKSKLPNARDIFDKAISKGCVDIKMILADKILDCVLSIKDTVTYGWITQQFPKIGRAHV